MQTKDILTVIISTLALTLSIFSILQKRAETERGLRVRLSELVDELNAITVENAKLPLTSRSIRAFSVP